MVPYDDKKIVIRTNVLPDGDIEIEDWELVYKIIIYLKLLLRERKL
jgi:hypothetical protein